jgi:hypothetical protein
MKSPEEIQGRCLCGAVRFSVRLPSLFCAHCHCSMCRRNHGAGYVTWFGVPHRQLSLLQGSGDLVRYASSEHGSRSFCGRCGSSLFCDNTTHPDHVDVALGAMDGPIDRAPQFHVYFDSGASWVAIGDELPRLGGKSGLEPLPPGGGGSKPERGRE